MAGNGVDSVWHCVDFGGHHWKSIHAVGVGTVFVVRGTVYSYWHSYGFYGERGAIGKGGDTAYVASIVT